MMLRFHIYFIALLFVGGSVNAAKSVLPGSFGTYDGEPRLANGHVNIDLLLAELTEQGANTYNWLVWHKASDWEDLQVFLPQARRKKIKVWVTLVPPTESSPDYHDSEPFKMDYEKWALEIGKLSAKEKNLVAWSIDDFRSNLKTFTPDKLQKMLQAAHSSNKKLAFVPCLYYPDVTTNFWSKYGKMIDGILFPYLSASGKTGLTDATRVEDEVRHIKSITGGTVPVMVDVYATPHASYPGGSTPPYVREVMARAHQAADGVLIYCHQGKKENPDTFAVIKEQFHQWSAK